jgi:D-alanine-D-alanine ligase
MGSLVRFRGTNSQDGDTWHLAEIDYILSQANHSPFDRMLDLGCGDGGRVRALNLRGYKNAVGLDALQTNIEAARRRNAKGTQQVSFIQADPLHCPFADRSFDEILILGDLFGHSSSPRHDVELLKEAQRLLRAGGALWLSITDGEWVRAHYQPDGVEPSANGFLCRHRTLSPDGFRLATRTIVADDECGVAIDRSSIECLYGPKDMTNILHQLGFETISYRAHEPGFALQPHARRDAAPRYLVRCLAPYPDGRSALRIVTAGRQ